MPPVVLILEKRSAIADEVLVAQTYQDTVLAGPGDLILVKDRSPIGKIFVEPWNTYTLRLRDLAPLYGKVESSALDAVRALKADPAAYPDWAIHPRPMAPEDPRIYFREMEVEVGYVFSSAAVSELMSLLEEGPLRLVYSSPVEAMAEIKKRSDDVLWDFEPQTVEQVLAAARFPPERYAMAAAADDREPFPANLVTVRSGRVERISPVEGEMLERQEEPEGFAIGGRLFIPEGIEILEVLCFLETGEGEFISAETLDWDSRGHFRARFPVSSLRDMELFAAVLHEAADG